MSEEGAGAAAELHLLAKDYARTPAEMLQDPDLELNLEIHRGYMKARQVARDAAKARAGDGALELPTGEDED